MLIYFHVFIQIMFAQNFKLEKNISAIILSFD